MGTRNIYDGSKQLELESGNHSKTLVDNQQMISTESNSTNYKIRTTPIRELFPSSSISAWLQASGGGEGLGGLLRPTKLRITPL